MLGQIKGVVIRCAQVLGAAVLACVSILGTWAVTRSWGVTAGAALAIIVLRWRRERPDAVLGVHASLCALQLGVVDSPLPADLAVVVSLYAVGRRGRRELTPVWIAAVVGGSALGAWDWNRDELGVVPLSLWARDMMQVSFVALCVAAVSWGLGRFVTQRRQLRASRLAAQEQRQVAHDAALRNEIAREVHDVVGHALALIAVQAEAGHYLAAGSEDDAEDLEVPLDERLEQATQALGQILATARSALADTRGLTRSLASPPPPAAPLNAAGHSASDDSRPASPVAEAPLRPVPRIADLPELIDDVRATDLPITLWVDDRLDDLLKDSGPEKSRDVLGAQAQLALYRTAQESLTNVLKHSEAATVEVRLEYRDNKARDEIILTVADHPDSAGTGVSSAAGNRLSDESALADAGGGQGLANLRQRLAAVGGVLDAGTGPDGGFIVRARIPSEAARPTFENP
ncbi:histidine kinase [Actinomyces sp. ZJ308]|uniref:sensor histidine kinase n=1 Tax=Actinomyces sp. ZJ308 TaxID=2708342 RepID=UPI001422CCA0|nr:histidine kinase [Actinomyces sp. ZJ308]